MNKLFFDIETKSVADLKKVGAWRYSEDESTEIVCLAYALNDGPVQLWLPGNEVPKEFNNFDVVVAHNALFEYAIFWNILWYVFNFTDIALNKWHCTQGMAKCVNLPASLGDLGQALQIKELKTADEGKKLINRISKPIRRKGGVKWAEVTQAEYDAFYEYCKQDVRATREIYNILTENVGDQIDKERDIWVLDFKQNIQGIPVDLNTLGTVVQGVEQLTKELEEFAQEKYGINPKSVPQMLDYVFTEFGVVMPDMKKETVRDYIQKCSISELVELLKLRQQMSMSSVKKLHALQDRTSNDGNIRYTLNYCGAGTGRWSGRGFQPQNLPKSNDKDIKNTIDTDIYDFSEGNGTFEGAKRLIPAMVKAKEGHTFLMGDFAAIETRCMAIVANQPELLDSLIYEKMAAKVLSLSLAEIDKDKRQLGKVIILACQYGMGHKKFFDTCQSWGMDISPSLAEHSVKTYRQTFKNVVKFWYDVENGFEAVLKHGIIPYGYDLVFERHGKAVTIKLPSGRKIYYHKARRGKNGLEYYNYSRKFWVYLYGGILAENIIQAIARDVLSDRMLVLDEVGLNPVFHVHDEIISEVSLDDLHRKQEQYTEIMNTAPDWLEDLPLVTEVDISERYYK